MSYVAAAKAALELSFKERTNVNGSNVPVYRGGNSFEIRSSDIRINPENGLVRTGYGLSLNIDPTKVEKFGGAYLLNNLPESLKKIIQRGNDAGHFEIVPAYEMALEEFQNLLNMIKVTPGG